MKKNASLTELFDEMTTGTNPPNLSAGPTQSLVPLKVQKFKSMSNGQSFNACKFGNEPQSGQLKNTKKLTWLKLD